MTVTTEDNDVIITADAGKAIRHIYTYDPSYTIEYRFQEGIDSVENWEDCELGIN